MINWTNEGHIYSKMYMSKYRIFSMANQWPIIEISLIFGTKQSTAILCERCEYIIQNGKETALKIRSHRRYYNQNS